MVKVIELTGDVVDARQLSQQAKASNRWQYKIMNQIIILNLTGSDLVLMGMCMAIAAYLVQAVWGRPWH